MNRRQFLSQTSLALLALAASTSPGCARLMQWSSSRGRGSERQIKPLAQSPEPTGTPRATVTPDLVVIKGEDPAKNLEKALAEFGGIERFVKRGAKVVIKPNLLTAAEPQYAVSTNPELVGAMVALCRKAGASDVIVLDRPTCPPNEAFQLSGIAATTNANGGRVKILTDRNFAETEIPKGRVLTQWPIVTDVFDADTFINMPIAKTHGMAVLTMSMKNLMGIMGGTRGMIHIDFDQKIVDVNSLVKPHLIALDAYRILLRNGPSGGSLSDVGHPKTVIVGTNQASVDAYGTTLFGMKPTDLAYLVKAGEQGIGEIDLAKLKIVKGTA